MRRVFLNRGPMRGTGSESSEHVPFFRNDDASPQFVPLRVEVTVRHKSRAKPRQSPSHVARALSLRLGVFLVFFDRHQFLQSVRDVFHGDGANERYAISGRPH